MALDIHRYEQKWASAERQVRASEISEHNKDLIIAYRDACLVRNVCGRVRLLRVQGCLLLYARILKKDFDQCTKQDIEALVGHLVTAQPPYSAETLGTYKAMLRGFMTWVVQPDQFPTKNVPPIVSWITCHVRARDKKRLERKDLLTPEDIEKLLYVCHNTRDKALIAVLWETGGRIAEIGNLQLKHVTKRDHGYTLDLTGKTGQRSPLIISSAPYLATWLNNHPFRNDPEAPLWVHYQYSKTAKHLQYDAIRYVLQRYFQRAEIKKPFHPHIFRHSRATYVLAQGIMGEQSAKTYFGWTPASDMLATYSHLIDQDANNAILRENNLTPQQLVQRDLQPITCRICNELNQAKAEYCTRCGAVLDLKKAYEHQTLHGVKDDVVLNLVKILVDKGLIDDAAQQIHDAGLGNALRQLAEHAKNTPTPGRAPPIPATVAPEAVPDAPVG
jgi:integrase/recombinase XerD